jgi:hypothetical protein
MEFKRVNLRWVYGFLITQEGFVLSQVFRVLFIIALVVFGIWFNHHLNQTPIEIKNDLPQTCGMWRKTPVIFLDEVNGKQVKNPTDIYTCIDPRIPVEK